LLVFETGKIFVNSKRTNPFLHRPVVAATRESTSSSQQHQVHQSKEPLKQFILDENSAVNRMRGNRIDANHLHMDIPCVDSWLPGHACDDDCKLLMTVINKK
jgi:hypothetical protein